MRILQIEDVLPHGVAYFDINVKFTLDAFSHLLGKFDEITYLIGPMINYDYGRVKYNVPKGHKGKGLGMTVLFLVT